MNHPSELQLLLEARCPKLSTTAEGLLTYQVWRNPTLNEVFVAITGNEGGGYFSREQVSLTRLLSCLSDLQSTGHAFPAIRLKAVFEGKSANNPSFMAAVLRHQQVLGEAPENPKLNVIGMDLASWRQQWLDAPVQTLDADPVPATASEPAPNPASPIKEGSDSTPAKGKGKAGKKLPATPSASVQPGEPTMDTPAMPEEVPHESDTPS